MRKLPLIVDEKNKSEKCQCLADSYSPNTCTQSVHTQSQYLHSSQFVWDPRSDVTHESESSLTVIIGKIFRNGCICVCYLLLAAELCLGILNVNISHPIFVPSITQSYNYKLWYNTMKMKKRTLLLTSLIDNSDSFVGFNVFGNLRWWLSFFSIVSR